MELIEIIISKKFDYACTFPVHNSQYYLHRFENKVICSKWVVMGFEPYPLRVDINTGYSNTRLES